VRHKKKKGGGKEGQWEGESQTGGVGRPDGEHKRGDAGETREGKILNPNGPK